MATVLSEKSEKALQALFPSTRVGATPSELVDALVDAELWRRGFPDTVSGAVHPFALTQGSVLKEEYDLSTHGHGDGWVLGALLVDPREFTLFNMRHGFPKGDEALRAIVAALRAVAPRSKVVRLHADGFAALLGPTAEQRVEEPLLVERAREALCQGFERVAPGCAPDFTFGLLELTVVDPPHWQVLGPLAWAECERALFIARKAPWEGVMKRTLRLEGRLPELPR